MSSESGSIHSAIAAYQEFYDKHGLTPGQARQQSRKGGGISREIAADAARIDNAVLKYAGGSVAVNELLRITIDKTRKWSREAVLNGYHEIIARWGLTPSQLLNDHRTGKIQLDEDAARDLSKLVGVTKKHFANSKEICGILGFKPPSRPRKRRFREASNNSLNVKLKPR